MSKWTKFRDSIVGAVTGAAKSASKNRAVVGTVLVTVLGAAGVKNIDVIAPVATNVYCTALVECDA